MEETRIDIPRNGKIDFIAVNDIIFCVADGNNSDIYTKRKVYKTIRLKIGEIMVKIKKDQLHTLRRVGKFYLMNLNHISSVDTKRGLVFLSNLPQPIIMPASLSKSSKKMEDGGIKISNKAMGDLLEAMDIEKRKKVLSPIILNKLNLPVEELNAEHLYASGNEYVDLGLPSGVKWSIRNLGAHPAFDGGYYQWNTCFSSESYEKDYFYPDKEDCVNKLWGDNWRLPTGEDFEELKENCILTWCTTERRECGCLITGRNGNRIFLPAYGWKSGTIEDAKKMKSIGSYWTSDVSKDLSRAESFHFMNMMDENGDETDEVACFFKNDSTFLGYCIRPVIKEVENPTQEKKLVLSVGDFDEPRFQSGIEDLHILNCSCYEPVLPADPVKALDNLRKWCDKYKPDFIMGYGTGCFFVHQLKGYKRMCVNPEWYPSHVINIEEYVASDQLTQKDIAQFAVMEKSQFDNDSKKEPCYLVIDEELENEEEEFCKHYNQKNVYYSPELKSPRMVYHTFIYPLVFKLW